MHSSRQRVILISLTWQDLRRFQITLEAKIQWIVINTRWVDWKKVYALTKVCLPWLKSFICYHKSQINIFHIEIQLWLNCSEARWEEIQKLVLLFVLLQQTLKLNKQWAVWNLERKLWKSKTVPKYK